jgi:hypothetical protein
MREQIASIPIKDLTDDEWSRLFVIPKEAILKPACEALEITYAEAEALSQQELYRRLALQGERLRREYPFNMALSILEEESPFKHPVKVSDTWVNLDVADEMGEADDCLDPSCTQWLDEEPLGDWNFRPVMSEEQEVMEGGKTKRGRGVTYFVDFENANDALLFKLGWGG